MAQRIPRNHFFLDCNFHGTIRTNIRYYWDQYCCPSVRGNHEAKEIDHNHEAKEIDHTSNKAESFTDFIISSSPLPSHHPIKRCLLLASIVWIALINLILDSNRITTKVAWMVKNNLRGAIRSLSGNASATIWDIITESVYICTSVKTWSINVMHFSNNEWEKLKWECVAARIDQQEHYILWWT